MISPDLKKSLLKLGLEKTDVVMIHGDAIVSTQLKLKNSRDNFLKSHSDCSLWVNSKAYNIVESIHTIWLTLIIDLLVGHPEYSVS